MKGCKNHYLAIGLATLVALVSGGCLVGRSPQHAAAGGSSGQAPAEIELPDSTESRDDRKAPVVQVEIAGSEVYARLYGYPIYPDGEGARGLALLRRDNWSSVRTRQRADQNGLLHEIEEYAELGCRIDGVRESAQKFVPLSLTCELPSPKALGGAKRPVIGKVAAAAKAEELLAEQSVERVFLGAFHLKSPDFESGSGEGYFNTTHGQLAFGFSRKKLQRVTYYFDPDVKGWQNPALWSKP